MSISLISEIFEGKYYAVLNNFDTNYPKKFFFACTALKCVFAYTLTSEMSQKYDKLRLTVKRVFKLINLLFI